MKNIQQELNFKKNLQKSRHKFKVSENQWNAANSINPFLWGSNLSSKISVSLDEKYYFN